ncbi:ABC transporter permease [Anaerosporobacter sp.]
MKILSLVKCSYDSLVKDKMKSFLSILGIIIGVITVVTVLSISEYFRTYVMNEYEKVGDNLMWITPDYSQSKNSVLSLEDVDNIKKLSFIQSTSPYAVTTEKLDINGRTGNVSVVGVNASYKDLRSLDVKGRFICDVDDLNCNRICVISDSVRKKYVNRSIDPIGSTITLNGEDFTIVGYLPSKKESTKNGLDEDNAIYIPYNSFCRYYESEKLDMYMFSIDDVASVTKYKTLIQQSLLSVSQDINLKIDIVSENMKNMQFVFNIITCVTILITAVSLMVSGIGIMNVLLMSITERRWEIGLRKALGADNRTILLQFLVESLLLCITGAIIGLFVSKASVIILSYFIKINIQLSIFAVLVSVSFCCLIGLFFGIFPAMKAAKFEPLECLEQ